MYLLAFVLCMGVAAGACWIIYQAVNTYNREFHKNYFYYLIAFYAFSVYGLVGQIGFRLFFQPTDPGEGFVAAAGNFLALLSLPFLFLSWGMLLKMGYALVESRPAKRVFAYHLFFLLAIIAMIWGGFYLTQNEIRMGQEALYIEIGLLILMEFGYLLLFGFRVFRGIIKMKPVAARLIKQFVILMFVGWAIRAAILPFMPERSWYAPLLMLFFFLSNGLAVFYIRFYGDSLFTPDLTGIPNERRKVILFDKYDITPREQEIIQKICEGKTNQQIADDLFISLQTVKDHTHRIYSKIGIHSRLKLARLVNG